MTKYELIRLCKEGDKGAMEILYSTYSMRMMSIIRKYVSDKKASEDILHDGFIVIFTNLEKLKDENSFEFWMGSIMRNISLKYLERLDLFSMLEEDIDIIDVPDTNDILTYEELDAIIEKLPNGYKTIFRLAVLENKSHKEISEILGIKPSTSASQLYHAKVLLRKLITDYRTKYYALLIILIAQFVYQYLDNMEDTHISSTQPQIATQANKAIHPNTINIQINKKLELSNSLKRKQTNKEFGIASSCVVSQSIYPDTMQSISDISDVCKDATHTDEIGITDSIKSPINQSGKLLNPGIKYSQSILNKKEWNISMAYTTTYSSTTKSSSFNDNGIISTQPLQTDYHYDIPLTLGITLDRRLNSSISLSTGISLTYQKGYINYKLEDRYAKSDFNNYYLSIPVGINYNMVNTKHFSGYIPCKFGIDIPIETKTQTSNPLYLNLPQQKGLTPQLFISSGIGIGYRVSERFDVYIEPSIKYYLNKSPEPSIWEGKRFEFNLPVGLRYSW